MSAARSTVATLDELVGARTDIDHNGRRLSVRSLGGATGGAPGAGSSVLWLAGMGMSANYLAPLHQRIARETRSVLFDRAGLGRSDPDTRPRTLERAADEVIAVLEALELDDAVLVAHSWGGPIARVAAARVPHRVRALVLLDPSDEHTRVGALLAHRRRGAALARATRLAGMLGQLRLLCARGYHPAVLAELRAVDLSARAQRAYLAELAEYERELDALIAAPLPLGDVPITLVSGQLLPRSGRVRARREAMVRAHEASARDTSGVRLIRAESSGHLLPITDPDLVIAEVVRALRSDRAGSEADELRP